MEKIRLKPLFIFFLYGFIVFLLLWIGLIIFIVTGMENTVHDIYHFCEHADPSEPHTFVIDENDACVLDWHQYLLEYFFIPMIFVLLLLTPSCFALHYLKRKK